MSEHLTRDDLMQLWRQQLPPDERLRALQHLRGCRECAALLDVDAETARVRAALAATDERHLDPDTELYPYVEDLLDAPEREIVESHLDDCAACRADVEELRALRGEQAGLPVLHRRRRVWLYVAAAAILALVIAGVALLVPRGPEVTPVAVEPPLPPTTTTTQTPRPEPPPRPEPSTYANAAWTAAVESALTAGALPAPLHPLPASADVLRGTNGSVSAALDPAGTAVDTTRPRLSWKAFRDATYVASIFLDDEEIARSGELREPRWTPPRDLRRGRTYTWQVEVRSGAGRRILPEPPAAPAMFRVLGQEEHDELAAARAQHPDDPLLVAVLASRAGLRRETEAALRELRERDPEDPRIRRLINIK